MALTGYTLPASTIWKLSQNIIGVADVSGVYTAGSPGAPFSSTTLPATVIEQQLGSIVTAQSNDATYGGMASFIFLAVPTSTTVTPGLAYTYKGDGTIVVVPTAVSSAAVSGLPVVWAINTVSSNTTSVQYTWFLCQGKGVAIKGATLNVQPSVPLFVSNVTAGKVRSTASIFRCLIGVRSANTATATGSILPIWVNFPAIGPGV
jgi:hypothetical protein